MNFNANVNNEQPTPQFSARNEQYTIDLIMFIFE